MPYYRLAGIGIVHMKLGGPRSKWPAPCCARVFANEPDRRDERCMAMSSFLCDHQVDAGTCDAPLCEAHAHEVGKNRHYCPLHFAQQSHQSPQRSLFGFISEVRP